MPCCTWLWFLAQAYHQIRCHALHAGDSIRREGKQSPLIECESDLKLCAWNFLHRHRRAFRDGVRATHEVLAPSPLRLSCSSLKAGAGISAMLIAIGPTFCNSPSLSYEIFVSSGATQRSLIHLSLTVAAAAREQQHAPRCLLASCL